jgi:hypothetical protein
MLPQTRRGVKKIWAARGQTPLNAENPPSTATTLPATHSASGDGSQKSAFSRSSGLPKRRMGVWTGAVYPVTASSAWSRATSSNAPAAAW